MARPVKLDVDVNLAPALAKLRAFEVRVAQATRFGVSGRPSLFPLTRAITPVARPGASQIIRRDPLGRIQQTLSLPTDQTARNLGSAGLAADMFQSARIAGLDKKIESRVLTEVASTGSPSAIAKGKAMRDRVRSMTKEQLTAEAADWRDSQNPTRARRAGRAFARTAPKVRKFVGGFTPEELASKGWIRRQVNTSVSAGMLRSGAEVGGAGMLMSRTTPAGLAVASIAFLQKVHLTRERLLREAAESGDPSNFDYGDVLSQSADSLWESVVSISENAAVLSLKGSLTFAEALISGASLLAFPDSGATNRTARAMTFSRWSAEAEGVYNEQLSRFHESVETWNRGLDNTVLAADVAARRAGNTRSEQALALGFTWGTGAQMAAKITHEIRQTVRNNAIDEYQDAKPYPRIKDIGGKKE